jgi:chromosomal replication initiator protein
MMTHEINEFRLHSNISWNKMGTIEQLPASVKIASANDVVRSVCSAFDIKRIDFEGKNRRKDFVLARHIASVYLLKFHRFTLARVGAICGNKNHATILHYKRNYVNLIDAKDDYLKTFLNKFNEELIKINPNFRTL